jgi:hypothetical protein
VPSSIATPYATRHRRGVTGSSGRHYRRNSTPPSLSSQQHLLTCPDNLISHQAANGSHHGTHHGNHGSEVSREKKVNVHKKKKTSNNHPAQEDNNNDCINVDNDAANSRNPSNEVNSDVEVKETMEVKSRNDNTINHKQSNMNQSSSISMYITGKWPVSQLGRQEGKENHHEIQQQCISWLVENIEELFIMKYMTCDAEYIKVNRSPKVKGWFLTIYGIANDIVKKVTSIIQRVSKEKNLGINVTDDGAKPSRTVYGTISQDKGYVNIEQIKEIYHDAGLAVSLGTPYMAYIGTVNCSRVSWSCNINDTPKMVAKKMLDAGYIIWYNVTPEKAICSKCCQSGHYRKACKNEACCFTCGRTGHPFHRCPRKNDRTLLCIHCKSENHRSYACPMIRTLMKMHYPRRHYDTHHAHDGNIATPSVPPIEKSRLAYVEVARVGYVNEIKQLTAKVDSLQTQLTAVTKQYAELQKQHAALIVSMQQSTSRPLRSNNDTIDEDKNPNHWQAVNNSRKRAATRSPSFLRGSIIPHYSTLQSPVYSPLGLSRSSSRYHSHGSQSAQRQ